MKEPNMIKSLTEKFWNAETTQEEEAFLKQLAETEDVALDPTEATYFTWINAQKQLSSQRPFTKPKQPEVKIIRLPQKNSWLWAAAASVLLVVGLFWLSQIQRPAQSKSMMADTFENPEEAWAATQQAIALVNAKLQKGTKPMENVHKLDNLNIIQMN